MDFTSESFFVLKGLPEIIITLVEASERKILL